MSNWVDDIGRKKLNDKEIKLLVGIFKLAVDSDMPSASDIQDTLDIFDNAQYNITAMKNGLDKAMKEKSNE